MYISSVIKLIVEAYSFACLILVTLLPTLYIAQLFFTKAKSKKTKAKAVQMQYIETELQEQLSDLETRVNQRLVEANDRMQHQYTAKQSRIEDLHERMEAFEARFEQEAFVHKVILDNKSLLLDIVLQSRETRTNRAERLGPQDHNSRVDQTYQMKSLSAAVQGIADTTKIFNDLLPRVVALEVSQSTAREAKAPRLNGFEQQIKDLSQKVDRIDETLDDCVHKSKGDQFFLKTFVKRNRTVLETKMKAMEEDIRGQLVTHDNQFVDIATKTHVEFLAMRQIARDGSDFCVELKASIDRVDARLMRLEQVIAEAATNDYEEYAEPDQIILY